MLQKKFLNNIWGLCLGLVSLTFMGCPYESTVTITTTPGEAVDKQILGVWSKPSENYVYTITGNDANSYKIEKVNDKKEITDTYEMKIEVVNGVKYATVKDLAKDGYYLNKITIKANKIILEEVTENITERFTNSAELYAFISKHQGLSFFFEKLEDTYIKD